MLGSFLEFSIPARPVEPAMQFYRSLGFQELPTADFIARPYAALWDGAAAIGLHDADLGGPILTFVRPGLKEYSRALRRFGIELAETELDEDSFNRAAFEDPSGQRVALLEARTFSPGVREASSVAACGHFLEFSVPTHSVADAAGFWTRLGLGKLDEGEHPHPWVRLEGHGLVVGFHQTRLRPGLTFEADDIAARGDYLRARGLAVDQGAPMAAAREPALTFEDPSGVAFYLLESSG